MNCRELAEFLHDYVERALPREQLDAFERHLTICPGCVDYVKSYRQTIDAAKDAHRETDAIAPTEIPEALVQAILAARAAKS